MTRERERLLAEAVRQACIDAWREGYESACMSGLCAEGALEVGLSAVQNLDLTNVTALGRIPQSAAQSQAATFDGFDVRRATSGDWPAIWSFFRPIVEAGESHPYPSDISEDAARAAWMDTPSATYVAVRDGRVVGSYYLKPNQPGRGAHVCNAGYMGRSGGARRWRRYGAVCAFTS